MTIGIVCYPTFGGSGVVATELGKSLASRGHTVHFITYDRPVRLMEYAEGIFYHEVSPGKYPLFDHLPYESALVSAIVDVARHEGLDLLHVHYAIPHASAAYMAREVLKTYGIDIPVITTLHGTDITLVGKERSYKPIVTFSMNQSDALTSVSDSLRQDTYDSFEVTKPIEVVPNFIDTKRFTPGEVSAFRRKIAPHDERVLIHVSNMRKVKRVKDAFGMFMKLRERLPIKMIFVGDGPERSDLVRSVRKEGLSQDVIFLGRQEMMEHILPMADLFVQTSETESFGLAALEGMASGLPVVATNSGGQPELIEHGKSGLLSGVGDVEAMADNAFAILSEETTLRQFAEQAILRARSFDVTNVVPLYEDLYTRTLAATRNPQPHGIS